MTTTTTQFKTLFLLAVLFIASSLAAQSPCKPGYVQAEDCIANAADPADGNCWWAYDGQSCLTLYGATSASQCADYCYSCLRCVYEYGCCAEGDPLLYSTCFDHCLGNM